MNIGDIQRHPELMGGDSCPRVPFPELLLFLQYLSMQLLLAGDIFCIEECGTANLISCGTMEGWSLPNFRRTNWWSEGMEITLAFYQECQPPQLDLICIPHLWGLDHRFLSSLCCVAFTKRILPILMTSFAFQLAFQWILKSKILTPYSSSLVDENTSTYVATFWISECFSSLIVWRIKMQNRNNQSIFYRTNNEFQFFHVDSSLSWYFCALHLTRWKIKNLWRKKFLHFWYIRLDST